MAKDRSFGALFFLVGILGATTYTWLLFFSSYDVILLKVTGFVAVVSVFVILAFIGYTMATTPPVMPVEAEPHQHETKEQQYSTSETKKPSETKRNKLYCGS